MSEELAVEEFWTPNTVLAYRFWYTDGVDLFSLASSAVYSTNGYSVGLSMDKLKWDVPAGEWEEAYCLSLIDCMPRSTSQRRWWLKDITDSCPHPFGRCGLWAMKPHITPRTYRPLREVVREVNSGRVVVGMVELSGTIIEHEHGYRASLARPLYGTITSLNRWRWRGCPPLKVASRV